jgi:hypothetical protein
METESIREQVVLLWIVTFDQNIDRTYTYTHPDKVLSSVEGTIRSIIQDAPHLESMVQEVLQRVADNMDCGFVPIIINDTTIAIRKLELDSQNPVVACLLDCYDYLSGDDEQQIYLLRKISSLFVDPL